jgi:hypothetical protein
MSEQEPLKSGVPYRIELVLSDGTPIHVTPRVLDLLLESNRVAKFKRSSGWATVGVDPIRARSGNQNGARYEGPERRSVY